MKDKRSPSVGALTPIIQYLGPDGNVWPFFTIQLEHYKPLDVHDSPDSDQYKTYLIRTRQTKEKICELLGDYTNDTGAILPDLDDPIHNPHPEKIAPGITLEAVIKYYIDHGNEKDADIMREELNKTKQQLYEDTKDPNSPINQLVINFPPTAEPPSTEILDTIRQTDRVKGIILK
jgi:hypothetical protein